MSISAFRKKKLLYVFNVFFGKFHRPFTSSFTSAFQCVTEKDARKLIFSHWLWCLLLWMKMSLVTSCKKRIHLSFTLSLDINNSGEIDKKDFEIAIQVGLGDIYNVFKVKLTFLLPDCHLQKICDLRGWPAGSEKNTETHEVMLKIWEGLRSKADKDNDGQVSRNTLSIYYNCCSKLNSLSLHLSSVDLYYSFNKILWCQTSVPSCVPLFRLPSLIVRRCWITCNYKNCYYELSSCFFQPYKRLAAF